MLVIDYEVFQYDWLCVVADLVDHSEQVIINNVEALKRLYDNHRYDIWIGYNIRHYDKWIQQGILAGFNPKEINDWIIVKKKDGWQFSDKLQDWPMNIYDVMPNPPIGLKTLEGFMGDDVRETTVPFDIDRKLTQEELERTIYYCRQDVEETIKVFAETISVFDAQMGIVKAFSLPLSCLGMTEARITAQVLGCKKIEWRDEFEYEFEPCIRLKKYSYVMDWFRENPGRIRQQMIDRGQDPDDRDAFRNEIYSKSNRLEAVVAEVPHNFGFGGVHGAIDHPIHYTGAIYHVDVNNYYPSYLLAWDRVTRAATNDNYALVYKTRKEMKAKQKAAETKEDAVRWKTAQLPYKKLLNALSGAMKDKFNPAYDPRNNNCMCINGQLMLLDLIEHLEAISGFELIQSNTDGLIVRIPDTDEAFYQMDDICWEWEQRCSTERCDIRLELDAISEIYQKDVNNYLWLEADGSVTRIGAYIKPLSVINYDLPILNRALVEYMTHKIPVEKTIKECNELIQFQKIVKLSDKYGWIEHEDGDHQRVNIGKRVVKWVDVYSTTRYSNASYRVFATKDSDHFGKLLKCKRLRDGSISKDKFGNTPDHCQILNGNVSKEECPSWLDRGWYIDKALKRLEDFGIYDQSN